MSEPHLDTLKDPSRLRLPPPNFKCGETIEEGDVGSVTFQCTLPNRSNNNNHNNANSEKEEESVLLFSCRGRSVGVLIENENAVNDDDLETTYETVDSNFFDKGYTLAGRTGFQVWAGSRLLIETLTWFRQSDSARLVELQHQLVNGAKVLELGSGVGVAGTCLAHAGAQVLLTDLPTLVENATHSNMCLNANEQIEGDENKKEEKAPFWLQEANPVPIGSGWAGTTSVDWTVPLQDQLTIKQMEHIEIILACDCVWLQSMVSSLLDTVSSALSASHSSSSSPTFIMSFQRRDTAEGKESTMFTTVESVLDAVRERNWSIECLSWRPVVLDGEVTEKEVFVFEFKPPPPSEER